MAHLRVQPRIARTCLRQAGQRSFATSRRTAAEQVRIVEVGPRDGLQNEKKSIPVATKMELIKRLARTGLRTIEAGSFVSPKWVPQMANSSEILQTILNQPPAAPVPITYQWLLPNTKGLDNFFAVYDSFTASAKAANDTSSSYPTPPPSPAAEDTPALRTSNQDPNQMPSSSAVDALGSFPTNRAPLPQMEVSIFAAATETFSKKNLNCTIAESVERFKPVMAQAKDHNVRVRAYISVALGCPYEGPDVPPRQVAELARELLEMGADEISVADTTGMGTAPKTSELLRTLSAAGIRNQDLALHFHDTFGQALVNTVVALEYGIRTFDSAVGGLGGCPYSPGATGNVATEDLVHCLNGLGADTGVNLDKVAKIGDWISNELGRPNESRAGKATLSKMQRSAPANPS